MSAKTRKPFIIRLKATGVRGSGKSTLLRHIQNLLTNDGFNCAFLETQDILLVKYPREKPGHNPESWPWNQKEKPHDP